MGDSKQSVYPLPSDGFRAVCHHTPLEEITRRGLRTATANPSRLQAVDHHRFVNMLSVISALARAKIGPRGWSAWRYSRLQRTTSVNCQKQTLAFAVRLEAIPVRTKGFPVTLEGNSSKELGVSRELRQAGRAVIGNFPVLSRISGNFKQLRLVRCSLSAQPA
jgi:hypothetical protein